MLHRQKFKFLKINKKNYEKKRFKKIEIKFGIFFFKLFRKKRRRAAEIGFCRSRLGGGYLLSHFRSTIGVVRLNFSVRNGKRWDPHAITTLVRFVRPGRGCGGVSVSSFLWLCLSFFRACDKVERNHTGNACICLLCSLGVCGDSLMSNRGCDLWV